MHTSLLSNTPKMLSPCDHQRLRFFHKQFNGFRSVSEPSAKCPNVLRLAEANANRNIHLAVFCLLIRRVLPRYVAFT